MTAAAKPFEVLRPSKPGLMAWLVDAFLAHQDLIWRILRFCPFILNLGKLVVVARNDDVREVLADHARFHVEQEPRMNQIMDGVPFMLGLDEQRAFDRSIAPMHAIVKPEDIPGLAKRCGARASALIADAGGRLEVVDFVRQITLDVLCHHYFGVTQPPDGSDLRIIAMRLYEFQVSPGKDAALEAEALRLARTLRDHIDDLITKRKGQQPRDDVLGRCVARQTELGLEAAQIRTDLIGLVVGALPQLPIAAPQALDQLLARPDQFRAAAEMAHAKDEAGLARALFEALRFDPMAPFLLRTCAKEQQIASGTLRRSTIKPGATVCAVLRSAMQDPRRVATPGAFDAGRVWSSYLHFGAGLHTCFAEHINRQVIPAMLMPLLARKGLARASGPAGKLSKRGFFTDEMWVTFDHHAVAGAAD